MSHEYVVTRPDPNESPNGTTHPKVPLEKETFSFFSYIKDIMLDAETDHRTVSEISYCDSFPQ